MPVTIKSYGGALGFKARILFPKLTSFAYLQTQRLLRKKETSGYIDKCLNSKDILVPLKINIETLNRCNGKCAFCPAGAGNETRPYKMMEQPLIDKLLGELKDMNFNGTLSFHLNNEPFLDKRMPDILASTAKLVPGARVALSSNGSVLTPDILDKISGTTDKLIINNYSNEYSLNGHNMELYEHIARNSGRFKNIDIVFQRRYSGEVLTNRAGSSPNKPHKNKPVRAACIMPFTDLTVFPSGIAGICCCDAQEKTNFGDLNKNTITEVFNSEQMRKLRQAVAFDRSGYDFCRYCDFFDSGMRMDFIRDKA